MKKQINVNIADLAHPEKNPRSHSKKQIQEMKRSIEMFGQFRPVIVDENNVILAGNGLVTAMRELGRETVEVLQYKNLTEAQKKKLMIADNQIASLGTDNMEIIEEFIKSLDGDLDVPGYDEETLAMLVAETEEVTRNVMAYGVFSPEEVADVRDSAERRMRPVEQTYTPVVPSGQFQPGTANPAQPQPAYTPAYDSAEEHFVTQQPQRFVICPHCGEKIYLD